jgi:lipopolysaccharide transport system permease protein
LALRDASDVSELDQRPVTVIAPATGWVSLRLGELRDYHELLFFLTWAEVKVRYKQTVLGIAWAVLQPFMAMVVFSIFFGELAGIPSDGVPYPVFAFAALVPWTYFSHVLGEASHSIRNFEEIITKVYFPRLLVPMAPVVAGLVDLGISFVMLLVIMAVYGIAPTAAVWTLPLFILLAAATALAVGLWLSALGVRYRDVQYTVPFLTQMWLFATPIVYSSSLVPEQWRALFGLNPMSGVVEGFRWALLDTQRPAIPQLVASVVATTALLIGGLFYFRRVERSFADVV